MFVCVCFNDLWVALTDWCIAFCISTEHYYKGPCVIQIGPTGGKMHLEWRASENTIAQGNSASQAIEWVRLEVPESGCILCIPAGCRHRYVFSDSTPVSATLVADDFEPPQISSITEDTAFVRSRIVELESAAKSWLRHLSQYSEEGPSRSTSCLFSQSLFG